MKDLEWIAFCEEAQIHIDNSKPSVENPKLVKGVPRFFECLSALSLFFQQEEPLVVTERSDNVRLMIYGFVDASKSGFGASLQLEDGIKYRIGTWSKDEENESSNYREFANAVETLEEEEHNGTINNATVILATDNSTVEAALYKGNSSNEKLY